MGSWASLWASFRNNAWTEFWKTIRKLTTQKMAWIVTKRTHHSFIHPFHKVYWRQWGPCPVGAEDAVLQGSMQEGRRTGHSQVRELRALHCVGATKHRWNSPRPWTSKSSSKHLLSGHARFRLLSAVSKTHLFAPRRLDPTSPLQSLHSPTVLSSRGSRLLGCLQYLLSPRCYIQPSFKDSPALLGEDFQNLRL